MERPERSLAPTSPSQRQESIDILRGVAVLGILLMNIRFFAMIQAAYFNPTAYGDLGGINFLVFALNHVFSDQKFMTLFSMLFGAGIVLMGERAEARGASAAVLHYRRTLWLLVLGAAHAYLLWYGDILVVYALCGLVVIAFRRRRPGTQLAVGLLFLAVSAALVVLASDSLSSWPDEVRADFLQGWAPDAATVAAELETYRGGWVGQLAHRVPSALEFHTVVFLAWGLWRAGGLMLIGMALYRWGVFSAALPSARYWWLAVLGFGIGIPVVAYGLMQHEARGWTLEYSFFNGTLYNYWGSLAVALGYLAVVMLWFQSRWLPGVLYRLSATGRMAFSNYIAQTLLCTSLFYGHGLGLFGILERWQQLGVVLGVWVLQLLWSPWWLARYRFGPLEWLWRSLTYWSPQPMRRQEPARQRGSRRQSRPHP